MKRLNMAKYFLTIYIEDDEYYMQGAVHLKIVKVSLHQNQYLLYNNCTIILAKKKPSN